MYRATCPCGAPVFYAAARRTITCQVCGLRVATAELRDAEQLVEAPSDEPDEGGAWPGATAAAAASEGAEGGGRPELARQESEDDRTIAAVLGLLRLMTQAQSTITAGKRRKQHKHGDKPEKPTGLPALNQVHGMSGFECKLIGPFVTRYGPGRGAQASSAVLLSDLGLSPVFDCGKASARAFRIREEDLGLAGYGRDESGSQRYLAPLLSAIRAANDGREALVPLHAAGDGHCLVHALSRCIAGREYFWHALRTNLQAHMQDHEARYLALLSDFFDGDEWKLIVSEASPDYVPPQDGTETLGLRKVHILGLANVLRRPIILFDGEAGMASSGDFSGVFLPLLQAREDCIDPATKQPFLPVAVAWSSSGYNHYVPLVPVQGPLPKIPAALLPSLWGQVPESTLRDYVVVGDDGCIRVGGTKEFTTEFAKKTMHIMGKVFQQQHGVCPAVVRKVFSDLYHGFPIVSEEQLVEQSKALVDAAKLQQCLACATVSIHEPPYTEADKQLGGWMHKAMQKCRCTDPTGPYQFLALPGRIFEYDAEKDEVTESKLKYPVQELSPGGRFYEVAKRKGLADKKAYSVQNEFGMSFEFTYDAAADLLVDRNRPKCPECPGQVRQMLPNGKVAVQDGDPSSVPRSAGSGFKTHWDGKLLENPPLTFSARFQHRGAEHYVAETWVHGEVDDPSLNSNPHTLAQHIVGTKFPGDFSTNQLQQALVDLIYRWIDKQPQLRRPALSNPYAVSSTAPPPPPSKPFSPTKAMKSSTLTGSRVLSKDSLGLNETERAIKASLPAKARAAQHRPDLSPSPSPGKNSSGTLPVISQPAKASAKPSPTSKSQAERREMTLRLITSTGTQRLVVPRGSTWAELKVRVAEATQVPVPRQVFHLGKKTEPIAAEDHDVLPFQHGDRLWLEKKKAEVREERGSPWAFGDTATGRPSPFGSAGMDTVFGDGALDAWSSGGLGNGGAGDEDEDGDGEDGGGQGWGKAKSAQRPAWTPQKRRKAGRASKRRTPPYASDWGTASNGTNSGSAAARDMEAEKAAAESILELLSTVLAADSATQQDLGPSGVLATLAKARFGALADQQVVSLAELPGRFFRFKALTQSFEEVEPTGRKQVSLSDLKSGRSFRPVSARRFQGSGHSLTSPSPGAGDEAPHR